MEVKIPNFSYLEKEVQLLPDKHEIIANNAMDELEHSKVIRDIEEIMFQIKLKQLQKDNYSKRLNALNKSIDIKVGIWIFIIVSLISIIIPFLIATYQSCLEKYYLVVITYMINTFIFSLFILVGYVIYVYKK